MNVFFRRLRLALGTQRQDPALRRGDRGVSHHPDEAPYAASAARSVARVRVPSSDASPVRRVRCISEPCPDVRRAVERLRGESRMSARIRHFATSQ